MKRPTDVPGLSAPPLEIVGDRSPHNSATLPTRAAGGDEPAVGATPGRGDRAAAEPPPHESGLQTELRERTADLQWLKAEYDNYRKRVRRDRLAVREIAVANVLGRLLPVLDALSEATELGEVTGRLRARGAGAGGRTGDARTGILRHCGRPLRPGRARGRLVHLQRPGRVPHLHRDPPPGIPRRRPPAAPRRSGGSRTAGRFIARKQRAPGDAVNQIVADGRYRSL